MSSQKVVSAAEVSTERSTALTLLGKACSEGMKAMLGGCAVAEIRQC